MQRPLQGQTSRAAAPPRVVRGQLAGACCSVQKLLLIFDQRRLRNVDHLQLPARQSVHLLSQRNASHAGETLPGGHHLHN